VVGPAFIVAQENEDDAYLSTRWKQLQTKVPDLARKIRRWAPPITSFVLRALVVTAPYLLKGSRCLSDSVQASAVGWKETASLFATKRRRGTRRKENGLVIQTPMGWFAHTGRPFVGYGGSTLAVAGHLLSLSRGRLIDRLTLN